MFTSQNHVYKSGSVQVHFINMKGEGYEHEMKLSPSPLCLVDFIKPIPFPFALPPLKSNLTWRKSVQFARGTSVILM